MKRITNKNDRRLLLQKLRMTVCRQIWLWDACGEISKILGEPGGDAVLLVNLIALGLGGKELQLSDLDAIEGGFMLINHSAAVKKLSLEMRRRLLEELQSAVRLHEELRSATTSLAKALGYTREEALGSIMAFATDADTGMELDERDLQELLGEAKAKD